MDRQMRMPSEIRKIVYKTYMVELMWKGLQT